jgi:hypothetical protein
MFKEMKEVKLKNIYKEEIDIMLNLIKEINSNLGKPVTLLNLIKKHKVKNSSTLSTILKTTYPNSFYKKNSWTKAPILIKSIIPEQPIVARRLIELTREYQKNVNKKYTEKISNIQKSIKPVDETPAKKVNRENYGINVVSQKSMTLHEGVVELITSFGKYRITGTFSIQEL